MANQNYMTPSYGNGPYQNTMTPTVTQPIPQNPMAMQNRGISSVAEVNGEEGMNGYPVAAGTTALLIDFNVGTFWLKSRDAYGVPREVRRFMFSEMIPQPQQPSQIQNGQNFQQIPQQQPAPVNNGVSREEFDEIKTMITKMYKDLGVEG